MAKFNLDTHVDTLGRLSQACVIITDIPKPEGGYPTLLLLHDQGGDHSVWSRFTSLERYMEDYRFAVVMVDGGHGYYVDSEFCSYEKVIFEDEIEKIAHFFNLNIDSAHLFVGGYGVGGYGAIRQLLRNSNRYKAGFAIKPKMDIVCEMKINNSKQTFIDMMEKTVQDIMLDGDYSSNGNILIIDDTDSLGHYRRIQDAIKIAIEGSDGWSYADKALPYALDFISKNL